jgi:Na+-driven multidrug efflux pump
LLWFNALFTPFWASSFVLPYGFKGAKDASYTMWVAIGSMWMCRIVVGYIFGVYFGFGVIGVWFGMFLDWIIRSIFFYYRLISGKWLWRHQKIS